MVKAYKAFNRDLTCTLGYGTFQYRENEWIEEPEANCGRNGFHCCYEPFNCLNYYGNVDRSAYYMVAAAGDVHEDGTDTRISCTRIKLIKRLSVEELVAHEVMYLYEHPFLKTSGMIHKESAALATKAPFCVVRGKAPMCSAEEGTVIGLIQEALDSKEIIAVNVFVIDGKDYLPGVTYGINGKE